MVICDVHVSTCAGDSVPETYLHVYLWGFMLHSDSSVAKCILSAVQKNPQQ